MYYYMEQIASWTKATKKRFFKIMQSKQRDIWRYYHLSSEDQNKKDV